MSSLFTHTKLYMELQLLKLRNIEIEMKRETITSITPRSENRGAADVCRVEEDW